jgi:predicted phage terminase large subunit-like protein
MSFSATLNAIQSLSEKWPKAYTKLIEDKANGPAVIDALQHRISGMVPVQPEGGKEARAHAVSCEVEAHNVYLPEGAPWVHDFIEECAAFPAGAHDDQVDAMTQALNRIRVTAGSRSGGVQVFWEERHPEFCVEPGWINTVF